MLTWRNFMTVLSARLYPLALAECRDLNIRFYGRLLLELERRLDAGQLNVYNKTGMAQEMDRRRDGARAARDAQQLVRPVATPVATQQRGGT